MNIEKLGNDHFLIKGLVDSYREERKRGKGQRDKQAPKNLYMSFVSRCDREIYYLFNNPDKRKSLADKTIITFRHGDMYHDEIQERFKKKRLVDNSRDIEYGLEDWDVDVSGRLDCFVSENGGLVVTELKSKNPYAFNVDEPYQDEIDQLLWYIYAAKKSKSLKERNIQDYGYMLYVERGEISDFPFSAWKIEYDAERVETIRERFKNLKKAIDEEQLPQRPHERDSIKCSYCRFKSFCWQGIPEIKEPEYLPDVSIEKPEQELVESAEKKYIQLKSEISEKENELEQVRDILIRYFKATGMKETEKILYCHSRSTTFDRDYLLKELKNKWHIIADPKTALLKKAIENGEIDAEVFERAKITIFNDSLRIKNRKEVKNAE